MRKKYLLFKWTIFLIVYLSLACPKNVFPQSLTSDEIKSLIQAFKKDDRGPYQAIRWFCPDGRVLPANQRCGQPGAIQHALHKDVVQKIAKEQGIYLGQILAGTSYEEFIDAGNQNSRLKQYQLEKYLQAIDDGWIMRRARYYRGALQAEDEEEWGLSFIKKTLADIELADSHFFIIRQISKDIPRKNNDNRWQRIRALSTAIADSLPLFTDMRIKLHGQPDSGDVMRVKKFLTGQKEKIKPDIEKQLNELKKELQLAFQPFNFQQLKEYCEKINAGSSLFSRLSRFILTYSKILNKSDSKVTSKKCRDIAGLLWNIRKNLLSEKSIDVRLSLLDLSVILETLLFREAIDWQPQTIGELLEKSYTLVFAAAGCGFIEVWEWEYIEKSLFVPENEGYLLLSDFLEKSALVRRVTEWGCGIVRANYNNDINRFAAFEPLAYGFIDDRIRASILLPLGETAGQLSDVAAQYSEIQNNVMGIKYQNQIRGLNPGYALGELVVIPGFLEGVKFSDSKIYLLQQAPIDLKPVAGIATISEGNLVSHIQLLARNLGIPNAVISNQNLSDLAVYSGEKIFYAVSQHGTVVMKPASKMTVEEISLFEKKKRSEDKIIVNANKIDLKQDKLISLRKLRASASGKICGPKAANLGELKYLFPERVIEGVVIPFGLFRKHMDQHMPGANASYWEFLQTIFAEAAMQRKNGFSEEEVETFLLQELARLHQAIKSIPLLQEFKDRLFSSFPAVFGKELGELPVFIRSDTNMEDLKDFTGAGLNLTVFNTAERDKIFQAIRDVWASPYTERSYRWRQKYLLNPENVFPSILIMPTVNVDKSGVLITSGIISSNSRDITVAFNRGVGGAVEGQTSESYLLKEDGSALLISPSREIKYNVTPPTGGAQTGYTNFSRRLLTNEELEQLRELTIDIKRKLPGASGIDTKGPFDVELGFKDGHIWLFQVRPYVENKRAASNAYLQNMDAKLPKNIKIAMNNKL